MSAMIQQGALLIPCNVLKNAVNDKQLTHMKEGKA